MKPIGKCLKAGGLPLYKYVLTPIGKGLKFLFCTLPIVFYRYVRSKFTGRLKRYVIKVCKDVYRDYLTPVGHAITGGATWLFITLPTRFRDYVLVPLKNQIVEGGRVLKRKVITPIGEGAVWLGHSIQEGALAIKNAAAYLLGSRPNHADDEEQVREDRKIA